MKKRTLAGNAKPLFSSTREFCCWKNDDGSITVVHHTEGERVISLTDYNTLKSSGWLPGLSPKPADGKPTFKL